MPSEEEITAACAAFRAQRLVYLPLGALRATMRAALEAAARVRAPKSFQCANGQELRNLHRARALDALAAHRCTTDLTDGFCGPREGKCRWGAKGHGGCVADAEHMLRALETVGIAVVWEHDPALNIIMEKRDA